jgi:hypothetical protein
VKLKIKILASTFLVLIILVITVPVIVITLRLNSVTLSALKSVFTPNHELSQTAANLFTQQAPYDCHLSWLISKFQSQDQQQISFLDAFKCSPEYLHIAMNYRPIDLELALMASQLYPNDEDVWMWLGFSQEYQKANAGLEAYQRVVALDSRNGIAWCAIGEILERQALFSQAEDAYLNCCKNQDPGGAGCYGAGQMAEKLGNLQLAVQYYRLSSSENALLRAKELEKSSLP